MKHLFILNPEAGKRDRTAELRAKIDAFCTQNGLDYGVEASAQKGDCTAIARRAAESGEETRIYACGGDGTLNEVVCGVAGAENVAVTCIPAGSGNDFLRLFSNPAAFADLSAFLNCREARFDVIKVGELTYGINIASVGVDARIAATAPKIKRIPLVTGSGAYVISTVYHLIKGLTQPMEITLDGETIMGKQTLLAVCSGRFYGGGFQPVPDAEPDDGLLDVLLVKGVSRLKAASVVGAYKQGRYKELPQMMAHRRTKSVTVRSEKPLCLNVDGEILSANEVTFSLAPAKLRFFYPEALSYHVGDICKTDKKELDFCAT